MFKFNDLNEATDSTYNYYPARSTRVNQFFVIDMEGVTRDVVVSFNSKTVSNIGSRKTRSWFCTVTAMRGKKGGLTIRNMGDVQKFQETLVRLIQDFMLKKRANVICMRIQKKGTGKMFDMRVKTLFKKLRYGCETTKIININDNSVDNELAEDYSFFVISRPGYDANKLNERLDDEGLSALAYKMQREPDIAARKTIIIKSDAIPGFEEFHDAVKEKWMEETPAASVRSSHKVDRSIILNEPGGLYTRRIENYTTHSVPEIANLARVALGNNDINMRIDESAQRLAPYINSVDINHRDDAAKICRNYINSRSKSATANYVELAKKIDYSSLDYETKSAVQSYTASRYVRINEALVTGKSTPSIDENIESIDRAFENVGILMDNINPKIDVLYRGLTMPVKSVRQILETGLFATTSFMSTTADVSIACEFATAQGVEVLRSSNTSKADMIDILDSNLGANINVVFIVETNGLSVLIPGHELGVGFECEFIVNRNTVFDADLIQMDENGYNVFIRLKVRDSNVQESVVTVMNKQERVEQLESLADLIKVTEASNEHVDIVNRHNTKLVP